MNHNQYIKLSTDLKKISTLIPLKWGKIQNNNTDNKIEMFYCKTIEQLEFEIRNLKLEEQNYFRRRWFIWMCSRIDEYLFSKEKNVSKNPNPKDKSWDIQFNPKLQFDLKGTIIPEKLTYNFNFNKERKLIEFYYKNQSKGIRNGLQNRLFIVHHSFKNKNQTTELRCNWALKEKAYKTFCNTIESSFMDFHIYKNVISKCIFIIENENGEHSFKIN